MDRDTAIIAGGGVLTIFGLAGVVGEMYDVLPGILTGTIPLFAILAVAGMAMLVYELVRSLPACEELVQRRKGACTCKEPEWSFWLTFYNAQRYCVMRCTTCDGYGYYVTPTFINYERLVFGELPDELQEHIRELSGASMHEGTAGPRIY
jgi:hypothetical protein